MGTARLTHKVPAVFFKTCNATNTPLHQLTVIINYSGLLLAAVHRETDNLHLHEGINDLAEM